MTILNSVEFAKRLTTKAFAEIEKRGNKVRFYGKNIALLREVFKKGYAVASAKKMHKLGLMWQTSDTALRIWALCDDGRIMPVR